MNLATHTPVNLRLYYALLTLLQQQRGGVRHSRSKGEYIYNANGRTVPDANIQKRLDGLVDDFHDNTARLAKRLDSGNLTVAQWQDRMRREIKDIHRTQYIVGKGGVENMTPRDYGRLGADLRHTQYKALDGFALDIADGKQLPDGSTRPFSEAEIRARSNLYMNASNKQYWRGKTEAKKEAGFIEEQRFLGAADNCEVCEGFEAQGRVPIGTLPDPGEECLGKVNCKCRKVYYTAEDLEQVEKKETEAAMKKAAKQKEDLGKQATLESKAAMKKMHGVVGKSEYLDSADAIKENMQFDIDDAATELAHQKALLDKSTAKGYQPFLSVDEKQKVINVFEKSTAKAQKKYDAAFEKATKKKAQLETVMAGQLTKADEAHFEALNALTKANFSGDQGAIFSAKFAVKETKKKRDETFALYEDAQNIKINDKAAEIEIQEQIKKAKNAKVVQNVADKQQAVKLGEEHLDLIQKQVQDLEKEMTEAAEKYNAAAGTPEAQAIWDAWGETTKQYDKATKIEKSFAASLTKAKSDLTKASPVRDDLPPQYSFKWEDVEPREQNVSDQDEDRTHDWYDDGPDGVWDVGNPKKHSPEHVKNTKNRIAEDLAANAGVSYLTADKFGRQWAGTSNDTDFRSLSVQKAAADVLDVEMSEWQKDKYAGVLWGRKNEIKRTGSVESSHLKYIGEDSLIGPDEVGDEDQALGNKSASEMTEKMVQATYDKTQRELRELKKDGVTHIKMYRGVQINPEMDGDIEGGDLVNYDSNALESWSIRPDIAKRFAGSYEGNYGDAGRIFMMEIPIEQIYATSITGPGCLNEWEFIVLRNEGDLFEIMTKEDQKDINIWESD